MFISPQVKWLEYHNNPTIRETLPEFLFNSWKSSYALGVDSKNSQPYICSDDEFSNIKKLSRSLFLYADDVLKKTATNLDDSQTGLALFDKNGCLLKLYGKPQFLQWAKENDIETKSVWTENTIGTNAISLGIQFQKPINVIAQEHFSQSFIYSAFYFAPILIEANQEKNVYGGIAIFGPYEKQSPHLAVIIASLAREIELQFFWFQSLDIFSTTFEGFMIINQSNNKNYIIHVNHNFHKTFKTRFPIGPYQYLEEIIDPWPNNSDFWNLVKKKEEVQDISITLSIQKIPTKVTLSIAPYYARNHHMEGIYIIFSSAERIRKLVSNQTGNNATFHFSHIIAKSENYCNVLSYAKKSAASESNVLLLGESGVGKDVIAQAIHNDSSRRNKPFIAVNCAAFAKDLISSELFGYDEGAFTGAKKGGNMGKFELANHGTIFLDEIGDMPLDLQAILLRVIEAKSFMRIGGSISMNIDVRIIAATNQNLVEKIEKKQFRSDLYYRLGVLKIHIPPLRNRKQDIMLLSEHFIEKICQRLSIPKLSLTPDAKEFLLTYPWPGNVRELQNSLEGLIQTNNDIIINREAFKNYLSNEVYEKFIPYTEAIDGELCDSVYKQIINISHKKNTREYLIQALQANRYNKSATAKHLGMSRRTFYRRLQEYNIDL